MNEINQSLHNWIISLHSNEAQLLGVIIGAIAALLAAVIAVLTAFKQLAKQFEHKVIYEGWRDFQSNLFEFSTALSNYGSTIQWLTYFVKSQDNPFVNAGNIPNYRLNKWNEVTSAYAELQISYIKFLRSYEAHEVIFIPLKKMYSSFLREYRRKVEEKQMRLMEEIFPEMHGKTNAVAEKTLVKSIDAYWYQSSEVSAFLDDFRRELQNVTVGKILGKTIPKRVPPDKKYKILTKKGFVLHRTSFGQVLKELGRLLKTIHPSGK